MANRAGEEGIEQILLANANIGGENVHRGAVLGALLGASAGRSGIPEHLVSGLKDSAAIEREVEAFVAAVLPRWTTA